MGELWQMGGGEVSKICLKVYQGKEHRTLLSLFVVFLRIFRFMLDGKKVYKSTLVYPFGILMG